MKYLLTAFLLIFSINAFCGTLFIDARRKGHHQDEIITHLYVADYGYNSEGIFVIRFQNGQVLYLGKPRDWDKFEVIQFVDHNELLRKP